MKPFTKIFILFILLNGAFLMNPSTASAQHDGVSLQLFYDQLSPYGQWVDYQNYGYVWIPNVEPGFTPYATDGHWVYTEIGWTWVSDYSWGWAPFHYGRWDYDNGFGWFWVPGTEWGPAWVAWRSAPGYYGWAPLQPGISINISLNDSYSRMPNTRWIFVNDRDIDRPDINRYYINRTENVTIVRNSITIENRHRDNDRNVTYIAGPSRLDVQRVIHKDVRPVTIQENDRPGQQMSNNQLRIYRPQIQKTNGNGRESVPSKVENVQNMRSTFERNKVNQPQNVNSPNSNNNRVSEPVKVENVKVIQPAMDKNRVNQPRNVNPPNNNNNRVSEPAKVENVKVVQPAMDKNRVNQPQNVSPPNTNNNRVSIPAKVENTKVVQPVMDKNRVNQPQNVNPPNTNNNRVSIPAKVENTKVVQPVMDKNRMNQSKKMAPAIIKKNVQPNQKKNNKREKDHQEK